MGCEGWNGGVLALCRGQRVKGGLPWEWVPPIDYSPLQVFSWLFPLPWGWSGAAGSTSGLVIVLILVLAPWCPEQIMKEEKRGQGGAQAADFCPSDWARAGGEVGGGC